MQITREQVEFRIKGLTERAEKLQADLNAVSGAIQDCEHWMKQLDAPEVSQVEKNE